MKGKKVVEGCRSLSNEEIKIIAESFAGEYPSRDKALFLVGTRTGFRVSELLSLRWKDIQKEDGSMVGLVSVDHTRLKGKGRNRSIPIDSEAQRALEQWSNDRGYHTPNDFVFTGRRHDKAISRVYAWQVLKDAYTRCELEGKLATHSMRKSFAQHYYVASGYDLLHTRDALGHGATRVTERYIHTDAGRVHDIARKISWE